MSYSHSRGSSHQFFLSNRVFDEDENTGASGSTHDLGVLGSRVPCLDTTLSNPTNSENPSVPTPLPDPTLPSELSNLPLNPTSPSPPHASAAETRRSTRPTCTPGYLHDFHVEATLPSRSLQSDSTRTGIPHSLSAVLSYDNLSPSHRVFSAQLSLFKEPNTFSEAAKHKVWHDAMFQELKAL